MKDARYSVMGYLLENMNDSMTVDLCDGSRLLAVHRGDDTCYVGADEWTDRNGKVALLSSGELRNDIERCLYRSEKYWVSL